MLSAKLFLLFLFIFLQNFLSDCSIFTHFNHLTLKSVGSKFKSFLLKAHDFIEPHKNTIIPPLFILFISNNIIRSLKSNSLFQQKIPFQAPFFQGWMVRSVDISKNLSIVTIIGCYSNKSSNSFDQFYIYSCIQQGEKYQIFDSIISNENISIQIDKFNKGKSISWIDSRFGHFKLGESTVEIDLKFPNNLQINILSNERIPWCEGDCLFPGPEGWLSLFSSLLPCHYFVHSLKSKTDYSINFLDERIIGKSLTHIEGNHGTAFPDGWVWSQAINQNDDSYCLVIGKITIGPLSPMNSCLYIKRSKGKAFIFRSIDLSNIKYKLDGITRKAEIEFISIFDQLKAKIVITDYERGHLVMIPTIKGFLNNPGCRESYFSKACIVIEDKLNGSKEILDFPMAAFEFGGSFVNLVHKNF